MAAAGQVGSTFVWESKFSIPLQALSEQTRLVCTIWHVDIVRDSAGTVTSQARQSCSFRLPRFPFHTTATTLSLSESSHFPCARPFHFLPISIL